jgi:aryl-alcohol dehydrogenase-like predicted oxidoreductase
MKTKRLGNSELQLTVIGFGTWAIGGAGWAYSWGAQDDKQSVAAILKGLESGINWIDTAPVYGLGHAEEIVGKALKLCAAKPIIATKCGMTWNANNKIKFSLKKDSIVREVEASLKRLDVDAIDLYQIHWPNPETEIEEGWEAIAGLVAQGKVRYAGVSNFSVAQLERARKIHPITSLQPPYSMLKREIEQAILPYCAEHHIGVVAYSPMQKGILTDKFTRAHVESLPADDHRVRDNDFKEPGLSANLKLAAQLREIAQDHRVSAAQLALAWVLARPEVTAAIVGARKPDQIAETVQAESLILRKEDFSKIAAILKQRS